MKTMRKALALVMALAIVMSLGITAFAAKAPTYSITITNPDDSVSINGNQYTAYKLFNLNQSGSNYSYTVDPNFAAFKMTLDASTVLPSEAATDASFEALETEINKDNIVDYVYALASYPDQLNAFAKKVYAWITTPNTVTKVGPATANSNKAVLDCDAAGAGYYLVFGTVTAADADSTNADNKTLTSALILDSTNPKAEVAAKVSAPTLDKTVNDVKDDTVQVGDVVDFKLTSKIPTTKGFTSYTMTFKDTMTAGLTLNQAIDGSDGAIKMTIKSSAVTLTKCTESELADKTSGAWIAFSSDGQTFTIKLADIKKTTGGVTPAANDAIEITYTAKVDDDALTNIVEKNTAILEYSNNPQDSTSFGKTPEKVTRLFDLKLDVTKVDGTETSTTLRDAEFKLAMASGTGEDGLPTGLTYYKRGTNKTEWVEKDSSDTLYSNPTDGTLSTRSGASADEYDYTDASFEGLGEGTYYLYETKAPAGYNLLKYPIKVVVAATHPTDPANSKVIDGYTFTVSEYDGSEFGTGTATTVDVPAGELGSLNLTHNVTVKNNSGNELPSTGGIGTTIFYTVGGVLMVTALALFITKKKMAAN